MTERTMARAPKRPGWMRNFAHPRGPVGTAVGWLMARKNREINELAVAALTPAPGEALLEIGFGPGVAIAMLVAAAPGGEVHGVDVSSAMVKQAARRNRGAVRAGTVKLRQGSAGALPYPALRFDGVVATNNYHLWPDPSAGLAEIVRVLRPAGRLVLGLRTAPERPGAYVPPGFTPEELDRVRRQLEEAGFSRIDDRRGVVGDREVVLMRAEL